MRRLICGLDKQIIHNTFTCPGFEKADNIVDEKKVCLNCVSAHLETTADMVEVKSAPTPSGGGRIKHLASH